MGNGRTSIPDVLDQFVDYLVKPGNGVWGSLHVVLDDGNVGNDTVRWVTDYARERGDEDGVRLGEILQAMSRTQRKRLPYIVAGELRRREIAAEDLKRAIEADGHYLVRVYADGSAKHTIRDPEGMAAWLAHNRTYRPGNALFVDGVCDRTIDRGYLSTEEIDFVEAAVREELARGDHDLAAVSGIALRQERFAGRRETRIGYEEEPDREHFLWGDSEPVYPVRTFR